MSYLHNAEWNGVSDEIVSNPHPNCPCRTIARWKSAVERGARLEGTASLVAVWEISIGYLNYISLWVESVELPQGSVSELEVKSKQWSGAGSGASTGVKRKQIRKT